jgi:hypothetical protein
MKWGALGQGRKRFGLDPCLILGSLVSKLVLFFLGMNISNPIGNGSLSLAKLPSWIEVEN